jgi:hypothetical protein
MDSGGIVKISELHTSSIFRVDYVVEYACIYTFGSAGLRGGMLRVVPVRTSGDSGQVRRVIIRVALSPQENCTD